LQFKRSAQFDIPLICEHYFPATIADMYDPVPLVREAHDLPGATLRERNDEILERIYIGRRFKNDTERLEKLFDLYTKMTTQPEKPKQTTKGRTKRNN
jgi:hypothetical protein